MLFMNLNFGCWTSHAATEQMASDMCTIRTSYSLTEESVKEFKIILQREKTATCLHETANDFRDVSKSFSIGFNYGSSNIIAMFRQKYYKSLEMKSKQKSKTNHDTKAQMQTHDPTRIFFNGINLCVDCMLKIFSKSPLLILLSMHNSFKTCFRLSGVVSWLKLLYYPPMLKRMIKYKAHADKEYDYLEYLFMRTIMWSLDNEKERLKDELLLSDEDVIYCLVRYTLIFSTAVRNNYFSRDRLEIICDNFIATEFISYYDFDYFCAMYKTLFTFCDSLRNLQSVSKLCITLFIISIKTKYSDFFMNTFTDEFQIVMKNVVNDILLHHRKNTIKCHNCHKFNENIKLCKGCKVIYYCSKYCQKRDWKKRHRLNCRGIKKIWWSRKWKPVKYSSWTKHFHLL
eukprot:433612_1